MYTRRLSLASLALVALCLFAPAVKADEIAIWNFNDQNLIVDRGAGTLTTTAAPVNVVYFSGTTINAQGGDVAGMALAIQGGTGQVNNGSILELRVSTVGFDNVNLSWAWQRTATGFNSIQVQLSDDGTNFTNFGGAHDAPLAFDDLVFALAANYANNPNFAVRWILNGSTGPTGNVRIDNLAVTGTPRGVVTVPEPATMLLLGTGLAGIAGRALRRRRATK